MGSMARYGVGLLALRWFGAGFPWGTLAVNAIGGLAMGALFAFHGDRRDVMALLGVGVLGGFTTFSSFSLEVVRMLEQGAAAVALIYVLVSVLFALGGVFAGMALARSFV